MDERDPIDAAWADCDLPETTAPEALELARCTFKTGWRAGEAHQRRETESENARLREALAFARVVILCGEPWTATCEEKIGGALAKS